MTDTILQVRDLSKSFGGFDAVKNVNLDIRRGTIHAIIGPNGAGKTTVFNLLTKFLAPTAGQILFNGNDITSLKPAEIANLGIVRSFQISAVFPHLTVLENVRLALQQRLGVGSHFWRSKRVLASLDEEVMNRLTQVGLKRFAHVPAVELPYGRKRALEIATTLGPEPELMLLDEPTQGMGAEDVSKVTDLIRKVSEGRTIVMVEHNLGVVSTLADTITVLNRGEVLAEGTYEEVSKNPEVMEAYMGVKPEDEGAGVAATTAMAKPATSGPPAQDTSQDLLRISDLNAWYGESHVLHGVDLELAQGEVITLLGRNGAGRTTTLRSILGMVDRRTGSIKIGGEEFISMPAHRIAPQGRIGYCPEERGIMASLTVEENLLLPPSVGEGGMSLDEIYAMFPNLKNVRRRMGTRLSGGEQQMLAIARILRTGARLLLLDEMTEGLAPVIVKTLGESIQRLKEQGFTIVLVEQNFRFAAPLADRHYVMEHGRVVDRIDAADIEASMDRLNHYLSV